MNDRKIPFEGIGNCRDLGGLHNISGLTIRSGLLIRSANLYGASDSDIRRLKTEYRLTEVIDLRTDLERIQKPDVRMKDVRFTIIPIFDEVTAGISHEEETDNSDFQARIPAMENLYRIMVTDEQCRINLGHAVQSIMEHNFSSGSVLWHCTEGKDRCGLVSALLLMALSVDRQYIMEDYLLTNEVNEAKAAMYYQKVLAAGKGEAAAEAVKNAFLAKEAYLEAALSAIDEKYQNTEIFLEDGLRIPKNTIQMFRKAILSPEE